MDDGGGAPALGPSGRPMPAPTKALPGTKRKIEVLRDRASAGQELWHPKDARHRGSVADKVRNLVRVTHAGTQPDTVDVC